MALTVKRQQEHRPICGSVNNVSADGGVSERSGGDEGASAAGGGEEVRQDQAIDYQTERTSAGRSQGRYCCLHDAAYRYGL